jgi:hypothetical protein
LRNGQVDMDARYRTSARKRLALRLLPPIRCGRRYKQRVVTSSPSSPL